MRYKRLQLLAALTCILLACKDSVIVKLPPPPKNRGVLELDCRTLNAIIFKGEVPVASCRKLGSHQFVLPTGTHLLMVVASGHYSQFHQVHIKNLTATKLLIELLKEPP